MKIARPIQSLIEAFSKLPGIGPKSAQRLTYYLLHVPQVQLDEFADSISRLKKDTVLCSICKNVSETDPCPICSDLMRDKSLVMVVEQPLDILAFERTRFKGVYHVLHGAINPLENIGPDEIYIQQLLDRAREQESVRIKEIIIATNPTMEGNATAMYLDKQLKIINLKLKIWGWGFQRGLIWNMLMRQRLHRRLRDDVNYELRITDYARNCQTSRTIS